DGNAEDFKRASYVRYLAAQVFGHGLALGLVAVVAHIVKAFGLRVPFAQHADVAGARVAEYFSANVEDRSKVLRRKILTQLLDHVHKDVDSRCGQSRARGHGAAALHRVVSAEDERHGVEQEDGRLGLIRHATESIST